MSDPQIQSPDAVTEMVGRGAFDLLAVEGDERQARYVRVKDELYWSAIDQGMSTADAWDMSEKMGQWTLDLVGRITATGGAGGGHA